MRRFQRVLHDRRSLLANFVYGERERAPVNRLCGGAFRPKELYVGYETSTFKTVQAFYEANTLLPVRPQRRFVSLQEPLDRVVTLLDGERPDVLVGYGGWIALIGEPIAITGLLLFVWGDAVRAGVRALWHTSGGRLTLGLALGVALAVAAGRSLQSVLAGVSPADPAVFVGAVSLVALMTLLGCLLPAIRAVRVDPIEAIRTQ